MIYLDHAATTPMRPAVWDAMAPYATDVFGNPSGSHAVAQQAKDALETARERVAAVLGVMPREIVFTGGGTEADNLAIKGVVSARGPGVGVVTVATEHDAVLESAATVSRAGHPVTVVGVDRHGRVDPDAVAAAVGPETAVVSVMYANNETGTIQPVADVVEAVRAVRDDVAVHTDAVQAFVSEDIRPYDLGVDLLTLAAHKFGGPKGVGVLFVRDGIRLDPVADGGGQELGRRSGTHNVMGAVGMAVAMEAASDDRPRFRTTVADARRRFEGAFGGVRTVPAELSLVQHCHVRLPGTRNETVLMKLDAAGVAASAASSCQSGAATVSHVLTAMGMGPAEARECVRFSFGWSTSPEEGERAGAIVAGVVGVTV